MFLGATFCPGGVLQGGDILSRLPTFWQQIKRINKDMQLILYSPESLGNTYLKDNISQYIRMQNNQMIICEEISAPPVDLTDIFATRMYATTSTSV